MSKNDKQDNWESIIQSKVPFAFWSLPGTKDWGGIAQEDTKIETSIKEGIDGFIVSSFNSDNNLRWIRSDRKIEMDESYSSADKVVKSEEKRSVIGIEETRKEDYLIQCQSIIDKIKDGQASKVVLSRVKITSLEISLKSMFLRLVDKYLNAMVFVYSFGDEVWIGASPETLLKVDGDEFMTMALAASKPIDDEREWTKKEIQEQAYVEGYVESILKDKGLVFSKKGPNTTIAGPVKHIISEFEGRLGKTNYFDLLKDLHPTPAVCGIPLVEAKKIIKQTEKHDRMDYTGFLGPISSKVLHMFVNLRSAKIVDQKIYLFLGGGITDGSIPEDEWEETELKANTILSIL